MKRIQEGQPFYVFVDYADTPAKLEKLFRSVKKLLPKEGRILSVIQQSEEKKSVVENVKKIISRYCDTIYYAPKGSSEESRISIIESAFRRAENCDCVLILGRECSAAKEAARQVAYELDLL